MSLRSPERVKVKHGWAPSWRRLPQQEQVNVVRVRVWQLPVRVIHWTMVACIVILSVTGFYIGTPFFNAGSGSAFLMGKVRAVHLVTGWILFTAIAARIYWAFVGNKWARWNQFIPTTRARLRLIPYTIGYYLFRHREPPPVAGHNPLAGLTYTAVFGLITLQMVTGIALARLSSNRTGIIWFLTGWVFDIASIPTVRMVHHMIMWLLLGFMVHHVYSVMLVDSEERSGLLSSIVTGDKTIPEERCCD